MPFKPHYKPLVLEDNCIRVWHESYQLPAQQGSVDLDAVFFERQLYGVIQVIYYAPLSSIERLELVAISDMDYRETIKIAQTMWANRRDEFIAQVKATYDR